MLIIRRHSGDTIYIGDDVEIVVMECGPGRVKLGIEAPARVTVLRGELKATREQNVASALGSSGVLPLLWLGGQERTGQTAKEARQPGDKH